MNEAIPSAETCLHQRCLSRYPAEAARCLEEMPVAEAASILANQSVTDTLDFWERLSPETGARVLEVLPPATAREILARIEPNCAAPLLSGLDEAARRDLLEALPKPEARELERAMSWPPGSAGALMDTQLTYFTGDMMVSAALKRMRSGRRRRFRVIFVVDDERRLTGVIDIPDLALANGNEELKELARPVAIHVDGMASNEEVVKRFENSRFSDLPVVDLDGRLLGVIRYQTLIETAMSESSADIQTMVGVSKDERALSNVGFAVRKRLPWLQINLATAFLAASVVGIFESTIAKYTALAVLLPVVAGQSGNTGAQALAVTMRGLALREIQTRHWPRIVFKEVNVGFWNGIAVALTTALGVYVWSQSVGLCLVISLSMVISMVAAGLAGAAIPILLTTAGQDPAQSSSIFLTTVTDIVGFFSFLGIATLLSGML